MRLGERLEELLRSLGVQADATQHMDVLILVGDEPIGPYQRPPLSKAALRDDLSVVPTPLKPVEFYAKAAIDLRLARRAERLDRQATKVLLTSGESISYDQLIIALGSRPVQLSVPGADLAGIVGLRTAVDAEQEFNNLFIGVGRGELLPYASYYLTGFLNEKPLADLRTDLMARGVKVSDDVKEPEDHIGTLCEIMAGIITGEFACDSDVSSQKAFFDAHMAKWAALFFTDLEEAQSSVLYAPVGSLGRAFMAVEADAFAIQ